MRSLLIPLCAAAVAASFPIVSAAQDALSPPEQQLVRYVEVHNDDALAFLERVVNMNSGTMNFEGVREVGRVFSGELDALGFSTRWIDGESFGRAGHLLGERSGNGPHLLLIGHLDTVFEKESPFQKYERVNESTASGPGVVDMKGGNVIIIQSMKALAAAGVLEDMTITVIMTGDEERPGHPIAVGRKALIAAAEAADIVVAFENGDNDAATAVVARRGSTKWRLRVAGRPAHSSQIFREDIGAGAINEAARIINDFYEAMAGEKYLTFNAGVILGGTTVEYDTTLSRGSGFGKSNVIPQHVIVEGDLRTVTPEQLRDSKARMRKIVGQHLPHSSAEITFRDSYPPMAPTDGNKRLLGILDRVSRDLGLGPMTAVDPMKAGAADVSFTAGLVDMVIDGIGLVGDDCHAIGETADLRTLPTQTKKAAVLLYRLSQGAGSK